MKAVYETPTFSMSECRVQDDFLLSGNGAPDIKYDDIENWSPIKPPKN